MMDHKAFAAAQAGLQPYLDAEARISATHIPKMRTKSVEFGASDEIADAAWRTLALSAMEEINPIGYTDEVRGEVRTITIYWIDANA